jgi:hypothetical protein
MNVKQHVPRLDLAPKLNRPLQLWNPLDYLRLLYWCLFFPQALRWYVETFADPRYRRATGRDFLIALRQDSMQRNLALQGLLLAVLVPLLLAAGLQVLGVPVHEGSIVAGVLVSVMGFAMAIVMLGAVGFAVLGMVFSAAGGMGTGVASGVILGMMAGAIAVVMVNLVVMEIVTAAIIVMFFGAASLVAGMADSVAECVAGGVALSVAVGAGVCVAAGVAVGVIAGMASNAVFGMIVGGTFGLAYGITRARLESYFVLAILRSWAWSRRKLLVSHTTWLPLPRMQECLEDWLGQDWTVGVHNVNQLLAYTLQFIPVVRAVNAVLACLPQERLLAAVSELGREPFDWDLVGFGSASLRSAMLQRAIRGLFLGFYAPRRWLEQFPAKPRLDTPSRAACAGFWYLHREEPVKAVEAFTIVRSLPGGEELILIAGSLAAALEAEDAAAVGHWLQPSARLAELHEPHLRPAVVRTLHRLHEVAQEADMAVHAYSPLMRSTAIGRAVAALTRLLADVDETCPQPECAIVKTVAERWRDILAAAGGQIGEQVLRQPVENPYEGYSGLPVERTFVGREGVLARLERLWATSPAAPLPPIILYGHRRMGKTSIINYLYCHRSPEMLVARTDMGDLAMADHTGQLILGFARAVCAAVQEAGLDVGPAPVAGDYATTGAARLALNALLEQLDLQMAGRRLTLAVDEYEIAEGKIEEGKFDPGFLRYLRSAAQRYRWLGLLFAGRQTLEDELHHYKAVFFASAKPERVSFLTREEALRLIRQPSDDFALEFEEALAEECYRITNGQPYLLQYLCWELVNRWNDRFLREGEETPRVLTLADLGALLTPTFYHDFFLQADYYFSGVWNEAGQDERRLLVALAAREDDRPLPRSELVNAAGLNPDEAETTIEAALRHDLIVEENGGFLLAVPLMRRWITEMHR